MVHKQPEHFEIKDKSLRVQIGNSGLAVDKALCCRRHLAFFKKAILKAKKRYVASPYAQGP